MNVFSFVKLFEVLVGVPALGAMLIGLGKQLGVIKDGQAPMANKVFNVVAYGLLYAVFSLEVEISVPEIDAIAKTVADFGFAAVGLIPLGIKISETVYKALRGLPLVGYSYTLERKAAK